MNPRPFDIVLFGATGFTGRQAAKYLAERAPVELNIALAGRKRNELEAVGAKLANRFKLIVADSSDRDSIARMCASTRILITTVGPFAQYGTPVVEACVEQGTHYADITGETFWVRKLMERLHVPAMQRGVRLIPFSGYDSVPSDIGTFLIADLFRRSGDTIRRVDAFHTGRGHVNGGSFATALNMFRTEGRAIFKDPFLLNDVRPNDPEVLAESSDPRGVRWNERAKTWAAPFFMGPINTRVVRRTANLNAYNWKSYGPKFVYQEWWPTKSRMRALGMAAGLRAMRLVAMTPPGRGLMKLFGPKPGQGPSDEEMRAGSYKSTFYGVSDSGKTAFAEVSGVGDPGNRATACFLCETALTLALNEPTLPPRAGFLTPASALGDGLTARLRAAGVKLESRLGD